MSILIADPDQTWTEKMSEFFQSKSLKTDLVFTGKDCQLKVYKNEYDSLVLDFDLREHSSLEVLRYMMLNHSKIKVILTFSSKSRFSDLGLSREDLRKLGVTDIFIRPFSLEALQKSIEGEKQFEEWKKLKDNNQARAEQELSAVDEEFTHIKADSFHSGNVTIFDLYIRVSRNKYIKILHKGDFFDESRLKKYIDERHVEFLYFKTKDRGIYINFVNELLAKAILNNKGQADQKIHTTKSVVEKYIEEVYTAGVKPQLIDEGKTICQNMYNMIHSNKGISQVLKTFEEYDPPAHCHLFLTAFFSTIIANHLEWTSTRTVEMTAFAGLLHDIGLLQLPPEFREKKIKEMNPKQLALYKSHPELGMQMLDKYPLIPSPVKQIIYQHHELINGEGFPNALTGPKIYPLAKITSLADAFSEYLVEKKVSPYQGIKEFIQDRQNIMKYDSTCLKGLVQGFLKDGK